jgi:hypothetical protein
MISASGCRQRWASDFRAITTASPGVQAVSGVATFDARGQEMLLVHTAEVCADLVARCRLCAINTLDGLSLPGRCCVCPGGGFPGVGDVVSGLPYGRGFEAHERGLSETLAELVEPPDFLLDVLTCADMTTGPDGSPVLADDRLSEILSRYPEDDLVHRDHFSGADIACRSRSR